MRVGLLPAVLMAVGLELSHVPAASTLRIYLLNEAIFSQSSMREAVLRIA